MLLLIFCKVENARQQAVKGHMVGQLALKFELFMIVAQIFTNIYKR